MRTSMDAIEISRKLRDLMGHPDEPGTCRDCGGSTVVPDLEATEDTGPGIWQTCPTCRGTGKGGLA